MSQAQIPQPNASQEAPAESYGSTESAPHGVTVSGLGNPGPTSREVTSHTLATNNVDRKLYEQFIHNASFPWTTSDPRGKLLWSMDIHPRAFNRITATLSSIYNTWGGGVDVNFKVAGTGFHAGALAFVRVPPNIDPRSLAGTYDYTAFEYMIMDPKQLEVATIHVGDQRQVNYHYTVQEKGAMASFSKGGTLACYVYMALNTSSTGTQQIEVVATTRLAPDFNFSQLIMPSADRDDDTLGIPGGLEDVLNFASTKTLPTTLDGLKLYRLVVQPSSLTKEVVQGTQDHTQLGGSLFNNYITTTPSRNSVARIEPGPETPGFTSPFKLTGGSITTLAYKNLVCVATAGLRDVKVATPVRMGIYRVNNILTAIVDINLDRSGGPWEVYANTPGVNYDLVMTGWENWTPPREESLLTFSYSNTPGFTQFSQLQHVLNHETYKTWIPTGKAALFTVIDNDTQLPLMSVKMYSNGFLTTSPRSGAGVFILGNLKFKFLYFIDINDAIPTNPNQNFVFLKMDSSNFTAIDT